MIFRISSTGLRSKWFLLTFQTMTSHRPYQTLACTRKNRGAPDQHRRLQGDSHRDGLQLRLSQQPTALDHRAVVASTAAALFVSQATCWWEDEEESLILFDQDLYHVVLFGSCYGPENAGTSKIHLCKSGINQMTGKQAPPPVA
jgi:hypothetical protein